MKAKIIVLSAFLVGFIHLEAQQDTARLIKLFEMSLEELMNLEVEVISKKAIAIRENPAIITVVSEDEIQNSGLRDFKEILEFYVPGFQFGADVEGAIGPSVRGMWAYEGKFLLMIDGLECNEEMFANLLFTNHYTLDNIRKIEVSRGPGSAVYGGYASLSVVNIITKNHEDRYISTSYSQMTDSYAQRYVNANWGKKYKDFSFSINGSYNQGVMSQLDNVDYYGNSMTMNGNSDINTTFLNANIKYKGLNIRTITDLFHYKQIDLWGRNHPEALDQHTDTYLAEISYKIVVNNKHEITPRFVYKFQQPWHLDVPEEEYANSKYSSKYQGGIIHSWKLSPKITLLTGTEYFNSTLILPDKHKDYEEYFKNNTSRLGVSNFSLYSQAIALNDIINVTLGCRYDLSSEYGYSFVPRIAFTKAYKHLHFKAMLSQSFRTPGGIIPNRIPEGVAGIEPEKATNYEFETGFNSSHFYFGLNLFSISFNKVIVYGSDTATGLGTYINSGRLGANGLEAEFRYRQNPINVIINYAHHYATQTDVLNYVVPTNDKYLLGFAPHRINTIINIKLYKTIVLNLLGAFHSKRYGYTHFDGDKDVLAEFDPILLVNTNLRFNKVFGTNLEATIGINNLLNAKMQYIQPYKGGHAPLPSLSRALKIKLLFAF